MRKIKLVISLFTFMNLLLAQPETTTNPGPPNPLLCTNGDLEIIRFNGKKAYKVVVDIPFKLGARHTPEDKPYSWELGNGFWPLTPKPIDLTGDATINKLPVNNSDFGETYGVLKLSSNTNTTVISTKKVKVFFKKDDVNIHNTSVPNWFYYWSQLPNLTVTGIKLFDPVSSSFTNKTGFSFGLKYVDKNQWQWPARTQPNGNKAITYGSNLIRNFDIHVFWPKITYLGKEYITEYHPDKNIAIGKGNGYYFINRTTKNDPEGIEVFNETVVHELEHWTIFEENWENGICLSDDKDKDGYKDSWEMTNNLDPTVPEPYTNGSGTRGYDYEEQRCRNKQKTLTKQLNMFDWSFDENIKGKNW